VAGVVLTPPTVPETRFSYPFDSAIAFLLAGRVVTPRRLLFWGRSIPLAFGWWVRVILIPALTGPDIAGRPALGGWMVLYPLLGVALRRGARA
jgi:hypothetical protein